MKGPSTMNNDSHLHAEADQRADTAFLVGVRFGRESERAKMLAEGYVIPEATR